MKVKVWFPLPFNGYSSGHSQFEIDMHENVDAFEMKDNGQLLIYMEKWKVKAIYPKGHWVKVIRLD